MSQKATTTPRILFVAPPGSTSTDGDSTHFKMALGSAYIIAYLQAHHIPARQLETHHSLTVTAAVASIIRTAAPVIGFTVYHANYIACCRIASLIKSQNPNAIIIFGGPTPTTCSSAIMENNPAVDICVINEGEDATLEIMTALDRVNYNYDASDLDKIAGIVYRVPPTGARSIKEHLTAEPGPVASPEYIKNKRRPLVFETCRSKAGSIDPLDKFPSPYLTGIAHTPFLGVLSARGCNQYCVYCSCTIMSRRHIGTHSIDRVVAELDYIHKNLYTDQIDVIDILDDAFTLIPGRALQICQKLIDNKIRLPLVCMTRCDSIDEATLDKIKEAGFKSIGFALESAIPRVLRMIGKLQPPRILPGDHFEKEMQFLKQFRHYVKYAKKIGIETVYSSIMIGLPTETPAEGRETISFLQSLGKELDYYSHNILRIFPGTPLYHNHRKYGYHLQQGVDNVHVRTHHPYDPGEVPVPAHPLSNVEEMALVLDNHNIKALSLPSCEKPAPSSASRPLGGEFAGFETVIIIREQLTRQLVEWLSGNMVINGGIIQIYPHQASARQHFDSNEALLQCFNVSSSVYDCYYRDSDDPDTLIPFRTHRTGKRCGFSFHLRPVTEVLTRSEAAFSMQEFCIEREASDIRQLYMTLEQICLEMGDDFDLSHAPVLPYFSGLCRWEGGQPNCQSLKRIFIDGRGDLRSCWNGSVVGSVGMEMTEVFFNLGRILEAISVERRCIGCEVEEECSQCLYPQPMEAENFCKLRKRVPTHEAARLVRTVEYFKEYSHPEE